MSREVSRKNLACRCEAKEEPPVLKCKTRTKTYKRFAMKHPNNMVQMNILGPFYLNSSSERNYIIGCLDDCSRNVASRWSERRRSVDVLKCVRRLDNGQW